MIVGYARVSTDDQTLALQLAAGESRQARFLGAIKLAVSWWPGTITDRRFDSLGRCPLAQPLNGRNVRLQSLRCRIRFREGRGQTGRSAHVTGGAPAKF